MISAMGRARAWLFTIALFAAMPATLAATPTPAGRVEKISVHGKSLEGNLSRESVDRTVYVYLPAGYDRGRQRYPVLYFLHGFASSPDKYMGYMDMPDSADRAIASGTMPPAIIVLPDALNRYGSSMYSNSPVIGDWEAFIARDLVSFIDHQYRTLARREARGLAGHSMGGYGTLRIGMKYPDTFVALYAMSSCCLSPRVVNPADAALEKLHTMEEIDAIPVRDRTTLSSSASWAPNPQHPPFFMDLPTRDGVPQPDVLARYSANSLTVLASQYVPQLRRHRAIKMDIGLQDSGSLLAGNSQLDGVLTQLGVVHEFATYEGDHMNRVGDRFEHHVLPFFGKLIEAPGRR